jgi:outer membrane protein
MKRTLGILSWLVLAAAAAAAEAAAPLTLQQAMDTALAQGDDAKLLAVNLSAARAQHQLNVSRNSLALTGTAGYSLPYYLDPLGVYRGASGLPNGVQAGVSLSGPLTTVAVTPTWWAPPVAPANGGSGFSTSSLSASASQTLWNGYPGGSAQATVDKSALTLQGRELAAAAGRLSIAYTVKQAFYTLLAAQRNLSIKSQIADKQQGVLRQIQSVYDLKLESLVNLKTAQLNARSAAVDQDSAQHDLDVARSSLAILMGMDPQAAFTAADAPDPEVPVQSVEEAVSRALTQRVELKQLGLSLKSDAVDLKLARGQAQPAVSVSGTLGAAVTWAQAPVSYEYGSVSVKVSMPIIDAGAVGNQVEALTRQDQAYAIQDGQLRKSIANAVRGAWDALRIAREKVEVARLSVDAGELQLSIAAAQHDAGTASTQDLLTATVNAANAQNSLASANSAAQLAALSLLNLMGI